MKSTCLLSCSVLLLLLTVMPSIEAFQQRAKQQQQTSRRRTTSLSLSSFDNSEPSGPQNATSAAPRKKTVFTNVHYVPPVVPTRASAKSTRTTHQHGADSSSSAVVVDAESKEKLAQGGQFVFEIGRNLGNIVVGSSIIGDKESRLLRSAGTALQDMGVAWHDWEAVTYAALDASQTMELVAQSLNHVCKTNDLQQALAGVAVELKCLSKKEQPEALNLQGLSLRLYQASKSVRGGDAGRQFEKSSRAAQELAKLYGATSNYLPRRWRLWWHNVQQNRRRGVVLEESDTDWQ